MRNDAQGRDLDPKVLAARLKLSVEHQVKEARRGFNSYARFCIRDEKGRALTQAVMHRAWDLHTRACWKAGMHPGILAPFGTGKTVQRIVGLAGYELGHDLSLRIKVVCNTDEKARERVVAVGNLIRSPQYRLVFPWVRPVPLDSLRQRPKWTEGALLIDRPGNAIDPTIAAHGILASGIGGRADLLLFDDCVDRKNAIDEPKLRDKVKGDFDDVWMSRLVSGGRVLYIGTPWHQGDLTHDLMERSGWCVLRMPVSADLSRIEMEVYNPPRNYPLQRLDGTYASAA